MFPEIGTRREQVATPRILQKTLSPAQKIYSAYDRKLLAEYAAIKKFRFAVEGRTFTIYTNHKPLTFAFQQKTDKCSPRQFRYLDYIAQFSTDIRHIRGMENIVADKLSRIETESQGFEYHQLKEAQ